MWRIILALALVSVAADFERRETEDPTKREITYHVDGNGGAVIKVDVGSGEKNGTVIKVNSWGDETITGDKADAILQMLKSRGTGLKFGGMNNKNILNSLGSLPVSNNFEANQNKDDDKTFYLSQTGGGSVNIKPGLDSGHMTETNIRGWITRKLSDKPFHEVLESAQNFKDHVTSGLASQEAAEGINRPTEYPHSYLYSVTPSVNKPMSSYHTPSYIPLPIRINRENSFHNLGGGFRNFSSFRSPYYTPSYISHPYGRQMNSASSLDSQQFNLYSPRLHSFSPNERFARSYDQNEVMDESSKRALVDLLVRNFVRKVYESSGSGNTMAVRNPFFRGIHSGFNDNAFFNYPNRFDYLRSRMVGKTSEGSEKDTNIFANSSPHNIRAENSGNKLDLLLMNFADIKPQYTSSRFYSSSQH